MQRKERIVVGAGLFLLIGAGVALAATKRERSEAVYPLQKIPLSFSHVQHFEADAECVACHDAARTSVRASDNLLPGHAEEDSPHAECEACHDIDKATDAEPLDPVSNCKACHPGFDKTVMKAPEPVVFPQANLRFNHQVHVEKKIDCERCHNSSYSADFAPEKRSMRQDVKLATRFQLPKMQSCLECHDGSSAPSACDTCHLTDGTGRLQLTFASGLLRPTQGDPFGLDHGPRYEFNHGTRAKLDREICMECHTENSCAQCHDSLTKPLAVHPNDYLSLHPVQARMDSTRCEACHRFQSFCAGCHERAGLGNDSDPGLRARNLRVHPKYAEWVDILGPKHHAIAASRDIKACIACHREESCMACHATAARRPGSRGTNPHPGGYAQGCRGLVAKNDRACLKCHTQADLATKGCR